MLEGIIFNMYLGMDCMEALKIFDFVKWKFFERKPSFSVLSADETIDYIIENRSSVCRFGDGEFSLINKSGELRFQSYDIALAHRLASILNDHSTLPNLLVCVPSFFVWERIAELRPESRLFWTKYLKNFPFCVYERMYGGGYGDSLITRPYMCYVKNEKSYAMSQNVFSKLKSIWEGRRVLLVEGEKSRLGVKNNLFSGCQSVARVLCPAENAWNVYSDILKRVKAIASRYELVLIALGPTATVLSYDLAMSGVWAIDIGHVDVEYEWFINKELEKTSLRYKYVNECYCDSIDDVCEDDDYYNQIIAKI